MYFTVFYCTDLKNGWTGTICKFNANNRGAGDRSFNDCGRKGVAKIIKLFEGDGKQFKDWIKCIQKYAFYTRVPNEQVKMVAYQASKDLVSGFLQCYLTDHPEHTWAQIKIELATRFAEITDSQHAFMLLRQVKQMRGEMCKFMQSVLQMMHFKDKDRTFLTDRWLGSSLTG